MNNNDLDINEIETNKPKVKNLEIKCLALAVASVLAFEASVYTLVRSTPNQISKSIFYNGENINNNKKDIYVFEKQVVKTVNAGTETIKLKNGSSYLQYKTRKEMFNIKIVSENKEVEGWNLIGLYDQNLNDNKIYAYKKTVYTNPSFIENEFGGFYQAPVGYSLDPKTNLAYNSSYYYASTDTLHLFGSETKNYEFLGLCDEKLYNQYNISLNNEIATIELGNVKTKK